MRAILAASILVLDLIVPAGAAAAVVEPGSLVIPTDEQTLNLEESDAYRLVDALLAGGVPLAWVPAVDGTSGGAFVIHAEFAAAAASQVDASLLAYPSVTAFRTATPLASHGNARR